MKLRLPPGVSLPAILAGAFLLCFVATRAAADPDEEMIADALRSSILGDSQRLWDLAEDRRRYGVSGIAENLAALAAASEEDAPTLSEWKRAMDGYRADRSTRSARRLIRFNEPRQRYFEARQDTRYEGLRRIYNALASPGVQAVQGQFFPLITLPFEAVESLIVGRPYLSPEQRRQLTLARRVKESQLEDAKLARETSRILKEWPPRRRNLAELQARQNAERALEDGRLFSAWFWTRREQMLGDTPQVLTKLGAKVQQLRMENVQRQKGTAEVLDGDPLFRSEEEQQDFAALVAPFLVDRNRDLFLERAAAFESTYYDSVLRDHIDAARAASAQRAGERDLANVYLDALQKNNFFTPWDFRADALEQHGDFHPEMPLREAEAKIDRRWREYVFEGEPPELALRSYTPEEARLRRRGWVERARALFITDTIARVLFLPFVDPFPKPELPDAAARVDQDFLDSREGRPWLRMVAEAMKDEKRFDDAAGVYERLGDSGAAANAERRAAKHLEKQADKADRPAVAVEKYEQILASYPDYNRTARVERKLEESRIAEESITAITKEELRQWPELLDAAELPLPRTMLDGSKANGELAKEGISILRRDAVSYEEIPGGRVEQPIAAENKTRLLQLLEPRRRLERVDEELAKPLPRKRVPLSVEAGMFPGFDVMPGLVPLDPNLQERKLYE